MLKGNVRIEPQERIEQGQVQDESWLNDMNSSLQKSETNAMQALSSVKLSGVNTALRPSVLQAGERNALWSTPQEAQRGTTNVLQSLSTQPTVYLNQKAPMPNRARGVIQVGHPLWTMMLQLSERVWLDLFQKSSRIPARTPDMIEKVRTRTIALLRTDPVFSKPVLEPQQAEQVLNSIVNEVLGYGPLDALLQDRTLDKIMIVNPRLAYVERQGEILDVNCYFEDEQHMRRIIRTMLLQAGRSIDTNASLIDLYLPDGSAVNIALPPNAIKGPTITLTTRWKRLPNLHELIQEGALSQTMADFLVACVQSRLNIVICGDQGSGRTSLMNALGVCFSENERIVTLEERAQLSLNQRHVITLEPTLVASENVSRVTMSDLLANALRMRPDRLLIDECRGEEMLGLLQAMQTGSKGLIINTYAENPRDCLERLELFCQMGTNHIAPEVLRNQISSLLDIIVFVSRFRDGSRKVRSIVGVQGAEGTMLRLQNIFHFYEESAESADVRGAFKHSGMRPKCLAKLADTHVQLPWS
jgi:pilus assembly protein CpaF